MEPKLHVAMRAFIVYEGKILLIRESLNYESPNKGRYDIPGGKVNPGENFQAGLLREIKEETGLKVKLGKPFSVQEWRPIIKGIEHHIIGTFIECFADSSSVILSDDHDKYEWINPNDYKNYDIVEAVKKVFKDYKNK